MNRLDCVNLILACSMTVAFAVGCADSTSTTRPTAADRALSDPWNYGPKPGVPDKEPKKDSSSFDSEGFKKDLNNVLNP